MQSYTEIAPLQTLLASLPALLNNDKTALSQSSGTAFPTDDLIAGMPCYRTDENKLYVLTDATEQTWLLLFDFTKAPTNKEYVDAQDALKAPLNSPNLTGNPVAPTPAKYSNDGKIATAEFVQAAGLHFPTSGGVLITANASMNAADGNKWHVFTAAATATLPALSGLLQGTTYVFTAHVDNCVVAPNGTDELKTASGTAANLLMNKGESAIVVMNANAWYVVVHGMGNTVPTFINTLSVKGETVGQGAQLWLKGDGATTPNKIIRANAGNLEFVNSGNTAVIGTITDGGELTMAGDVKAFSDERLKSNIRTIPDALQKVMNLRGVFYNKSGMPSTGVIAQEVQAVLPEVVDDRAEYMAVAYGNMVGVLIEAIKELSYKVDALESKQEA
jgi:hypothetical protein